MKNRLIFIVIITLSLSVKAQIYTPSGTIQGASINSNIGIGTSYDEGEFISPVEKLTIGELGGNFAVQDRRTSTTVKYKSGYKFYDFVGEAASILLEHNSYFGNNARALNFSVNGDERVRISANGDVGIGTKTPTAKLHVNNGDNSYGTILSNASESAFSLYAKSLTTQPFAESFRLGMKYDYTESNGFISFYRGGSISGGYLGFSTNGSERIRISDIGNVGIGTSNPSSKLEVVGQINSFNVSSGQFDVNTSTKNFINFSGNNHGSVLISSNLYFSDDGIMKIANTHSMMSGSAILFPGNFQPNQGKILFFFSNPASVTENQVFSRAIAMEITGDGNIGIGKSNPTNKLDVKGIIHSQEVKVDMTGWSDFVFKKEYNLPTLEVVEKHIVEKGHLENIPSEEEVLKNGINLGEMNAKLLQKIEELTLYAIEQEKNTAKLVELIEKQNKRLKVLEENKK